jgi:predicted aspartyl protease
VKLEKAGSDGQESAIDTIKLNWPIINNSTNQNFSSVRVGSNFNQYDNGFYTTCKLNNVSVDFLIDCGATSSLISQKKLHEIDSTGQLFKILPVSSTLHTVNGEPMSVSSSVDLLLKLGDQHYDITFIVCSMDTDY